MTLTWQIQRNQFVIIKWRLSIMHVTINGHSIYSVSYPTLKFLSSCTHFKSTSSSGSLAPAGPQPMQKSCMLRSAPLSAWTKQLSVYSVLTSHYYSNIGMRIKTSINWISVSFKSCKEAAHMHMHTCKHVCMRMHACVHTHTCHNTANKL